MLAIRSRRLRTVALATAVVLAGLAAPALTTTTATATTPTAASASTAAYDAYYDAAAGNRPQEGRLA
ncbi:hypothetical protein [Streptomyces sp. NPDC004976]